MIKDLEEERDRLRTNLETVVSGRVYCEQCPAGWWEINSRCYFLSTEQKTWEDSRKYCKSKGADLVVISSEQEQRALYRLDGDAYLLFWIGLYGTTETTGWKWVDGSALTKPFWQSGQPDVGGPNNMEDCVEMYHKNPVLASWNDAPCGAKRRWLCEKDQAEKILA
ncbi:C-type lectin domain family 4 member G-like [Sander vitreus]